jgi:hypothetical protein
MTRLTDDAFSLIDSATDDERRVILEYVRRRVVIHPLETQWGTTAEAILGAISRSSDLTQRGIRGILAEATFEETVAPAMAKAGWQPEPISGDQSYDFVLNRGTERIRIQVKLQRREKGLPKELPRRSRLALRAAPETLFVVEVQKTRSGQKAGEQTRPYRFGDFDILAVNLHPSTGDWKKFLYTVGDWLLPRAANPNLIEIFQPVPIAPDEYWTDDLQVCIEWLFQRKQNRLYS